MKLFCNRTLRRQVLEYIQYTERKAYTQEFIPSKEEEVLYDLVSEYLRRPNLPALPVSQRMLMTLFCENYWLHQPLPLSTPWMLLQANLSDVSKKMQIGTYRDVGTGLC